MNKFALIPGWVFCLLLLVLTSCDASVFAQEPRPAPVTVPDVVIEREQHVIVDGPAPVTAPLPPLAPIGPLHNFTFNFVSSEMSFDRKVVKGAPYSADAVTETIKTLGDGNRIVRKTSAKVYRDGEGRTRREQTLTAVGPFATAEDPPQIITINDPVAGVSYSLSPRHMTARKTKTGVIAVNARALAPVRSDVLAEAPAGSGNTNQRRIMVYSGGSGVTANGPANEIITKGVAGGVTAGVGADMQFTMLDKNWKPVTESLGVQTIGGVSAEGTRTVTTIPAGAIGNERAIEIVNERWYSPELQTVVMSKHNDPQNGETTYRLTSVERNEPAPSLFEVPADYKVQDVPFNFQHRVIRKPEDHK